MIKNLKKGFLLCTCFVLLFSGASAQTEKGNYLLGGSGDASLSFNYTTRNFNCSIQPTMAIFVIKNFAIGATYSFGVSGSHTINAATNIGKESNSFNTSLGPYLKYYIGKKSLKGVISASAAYIISTGVRTETNTSPSQAVGGFLVGGTIGIAYFLNQNISLEPGLYINTSGYQTQIPSTRAGFSLGLYAVLSKRKPPVIQ